MAYLYATLIERNSFTGYTIEDIPEEHKDAVLEILAEKGLDGYNNPLPVEQPTE